MLASLGVMANCSPIGEMAECDGLSDSPEDDSKGGAEFMTGVYTRGGVENETFVGCCAYSINVGTVLKYTGASTHLTVYAYPCYSFYI